MKKQRKEKSMKRCPYCGECNEDDSREKHHNCCPNQYPFPDCKALALADWQNGFDCTNDLDAPNTDSTFRSPVFQLGYRMSHPGSQLGL